MGLHGRWESRLALVGLVVVACPVGAEEATPVERRQIEEVVVTAERRESTVQDTAISITAFTGEFIEEFGVRNQEDLQAYIPATTIDPYDVSVRGIGRLYRALGGDPGVATYFNGAYSEDAFFATTEGGLYDIERIEVLRGPQGTLYGRNGVGGAINFITKKPTEEFQGEVRMVGGDYDTFETYGILSGALVPDWLSARLVGSKQERDGTIDNIGFGDDLDGYDDDNIALALQFTPTESIEVNARVNDRNYRRVIGSAQGAGAIVVSENGGNTRNTTAQTWGYRAVDPAVACPSFSGRTAPVGGLGCTVPGRQILTFTHNGVTRNGQFVVPGVDVAPASTGQRPNYAFGGDPALAARSLIGNGREVPEMDGSDLIVWQSGFNDESIDQWAVYADASWDVTDWLVLKYIGSKTEYMYQRTTDDDHTGNDPLDSQFYAGQENENYQHEVQFFVDIGDNIAITSGVFYYKNHIDLALDFYSQDLARYTNAANYGQLRSTGLLPVMLNTMSANIANRAGTCELKGVAPGPQFNDPTVTHVCSLTGVWSGEFAGNGNATPRGPDTGGTTFIWDTENRSEATAFYTQAEWQINDLFALTLGGRITNDDKEGEERLFLYAENPAGLVNTAGVPVSLLAYNVATGALNADGTPTAGGLNESIPIRFRGRPQSQSIYRSMEDSFDETTWRVNIDWTPNDETLLYLSATTGYRAGGFNLGFFSVTPTFDSETILAYELGYKGQLLDGTLQFNAAVYLYQYDDIQAQFTVENPFLGGTNTSVRNVPEAENYGFEADMMWLATESITLGGAFSYTSAEYQDDITDPNTGEGGVVDVNNPFAPTSLFTPDQLRLGLDGLQLNRIPEYKVNAWGQYTWRLGGNGEIDLMTSYSWQDEMTWDESDSPLDRIPAFARWDARATWNSSDRTWMVAGFVNNIMDEIGLRSLDAESEGAGYLRSVTPTLPRIWGMEARYRFGAH